MTIQSIIARISIISIVSIILLSKLSNSFTFHPPLFSSSSSSSSNRACLKSTKLSSTFNSNINVKNNPNLYSRSQPSSPFTPSSTSLNANLLTRFYTVLKSNFSHLINKYSDPEKILNLAIDEMQIDLLNLRHSHAELNSQIKRLNNKVVSVKEDCEMWYKRANVCVDNGDDDMAKEALNKRSSCIKQAADLNRQISSLGTNVKRLKTSIDVLANKVVTSKEKKDEIIVRARTADGLKRVNDMISGYSKKSGSVEAFDRMSRKVDDMEVQADISIGMADEAVESEGGGKEEKKFKTLEEGAKVDEIIERMKSERRGGQMKLFGRERVIDAEEVLVLK